MVDDTDSGPVPESLVPYDVWTEEALRHVAARAIAYAAEHGLPGEHHLYITFRTDVPGVVIPPRLRAQYPHEMTIVLQHQFWGLALDEATATMTVGLSFGGVPSTLRIPMAALTAFADPHVRYGLRFRVADAPAAAALPIAGPAIVATEVPEPEGSAPDPTPQVVSLDAFRRRAPPKEGT